MKHCFIISLSRACLFQNRTTAPWAVRAVCLYSCPLSKAESSSDSCRRSSSTHTDQFSSAIPCLAVVDIKVQFSINCFLRTRPNAQNYSSLCCGNHGNPDLVTFIKFTILFSLQILSGLT